MDIVEYLVGYGLQGDFGRFRPLRPMPCRRAERVVVRSHRGLEVGTVLREATPGHAGFLPNTTVGQILRRLTPDDERQEQVLLERGRHIVERGSGLVQELRLPVEVIDAELLLDGENAVLQHLRFDDCDVRPLVSTLSREFSVLLTLVDLAAPKQEDQSHGCGSCGAGGCGSCGSGGCGTCGSAKPEEIQEYFAELRQKMERRHTLL
jgi:cell fate regulator YaaT (PSP1 superfamily)